MSEFLSVAISPAECFAARAEGTHSTARCLIGGERWGKESEERTEIRRGG